MREGATKKTSRTDWKRLASMKDDEIDYSDIPPLTDAFFDRAVLRSPTMVHKEKKGSWWTMARKEKGSWWTLLSFFGLFLALFVIASFIDSMAFSLSLTNRDGGQLVWPLAVLMKILTWTWSNVAFLAILASLIGEYGRVASSRSATLNYRGATARGFFVFLAALGSQLVVTGNIPTQEPQGAYFRIAGFVALSGFMAGYSPRYFRGLLEKLFADDTSASGLQSSLNHETKHKKLI